ncbi:ATP-binding protein [Lentzea sp. NPDC034063]|uniref:sensor histidine kinase n=1 Tax=unclassified Lentzea TaxID=2643253 RepID=UPI0033D0018C
MKSLLVRFFLFSLVIAACSIAVTAWLASQATTGAIRQEQGDALRTDAEIYDKLLGIAATHKTWVEAESDVDGLAREYGRRLALTDRGGKTLIDTGTAGSPPLPLTPKVSIDPLNVDVVLKAGATSKIDPRAVGPFVLTDEEHDKLDNTAQRVLECVKQQNVTIVEAPNRRPRVSTDEPGREERWDEKTCPAGNALRLLTKTELDAYAELLELWKGCISRLPGQWPLDSKASQFTLDWEVLMTRHSEPPVAECLESARKEQLRPFVAEYAHLYITEPTSGAPQAIDLSTTGTQQITLMALGILAIAGFASWVTATQLVRPIRALTAATKRTAEGDRTARVDGGAGEIGELAKSFNAMSEKLAETERQRQAMVSDVAHELRTPLGNITGWLEATQDGLAEPDPHLIDMLLEESLLLQRLVDDLHDLAQADAGTLRLHPEPIALDDVVDQVVNAQQNREILLRAETTPVHLSADPVRLRQALGNLVANAVRYTPPGGEVVVKLFQWKDKAILEVTDTGTGIAPEDLPHVFDRFWRADKSRSRRTGGSGLGLAITRHLVEAHGGTVSVTSTLGEGSTFRISLPA